MYTQIFFVTSVRGSFFAPQMAAKASLSCFGAKMPTPFFFIAATFFLALSLCAFFPMVRKCRRPSSSSQRRSSWRCRSVPSSRWCENADALLLHRSDVLLGVVALCLLPDGALLRLHLLQRRLGDRRLRGLGRRRRSLGRRRHSDEGMKVQARLEP